MICTSMHNNTTLALKYVHNIIILLTGFNLTYNLSRPYTS